ncbi:MAG: hypothetical protein EXR69_14220 [Myxococcales bacterium]|nr:hypothetical protein [Myxococcales bacterium]
MAPASFRLDTLAANLIERLEPVRRAYVDSPEAAREVMLKTTEEIADNVARECRAVMGDEVQARRIETEAVATFLPRYVRLAIEQNRVERWEAITPLNVMMQRLIPLLLGLFGAGLMMRLVAGRWDLVFYVIPLLALFWPEWIGAWARRRYRAELQELANDLGQLQDADERLSPGVEVAEVGPMKAERARRRPASNHEKG